MRVRFSLRVLLILFTVIAVLLGGAAHFVFRVKEEAQRYERAAARLDDLGYLLDVDEDHPNESAPAWLISLSRQWIDPKAYPPAVHVELLNELLTLEEAKDRLAIVGDLREVSRLRIYPDVLNAEYVELLARVKGLRDLEIGTPQLDAGAGARLTELPAISHLSVEEPIADSVLEALAQLPNLSVLTVDISQLTGQSIKKARGFPKLRELTFFGSIRDPGPLGAILQSESLEKLELEYCRISPNALVALENARSVSDLGVDGDDGNDDLFLHVAKLGKLKKIHAYGLRASQLSHIGELAACRNLSEVILTGMKLRDRDFLLIQPLTQLKLLSLEGEVSDEAVEVFLRAAPSCKVKVYSARDAWQEFSIVDGEMDVKKPELSY